MVRSCSSVPVEKSGHKIEERDHMSDESTNVDETTAYLIGLPRTLAKMADGKVAGGKVFETSKKT